MDVDKKLAESVAKSVIHSFFKDGLLTQNDIKDKPTLSRKVGRLLKSQTVFDVVIDHTNTLLSSAQEYARKGNYDYAKIFYSLFFEHSTNGLISYECRKRKISKESTNEILRLGLEHKLTWLFELLKLPKYKSGNLTLIKKLSDERNAFVHYKFKPRPLDADTSIEETKNVKQIKDVSQCVKYHKVYISKVLYSGNKKRLSKLI